MQLQQWWENLSMKSVRLRDRNKKHERLFVSDAMEVSNES